MIRKILKFFMTVIGIVILFWCCSIYMQSWDASHWPQAKCKIISSSLTIDHLPKFIDSTDNPLRWYGAHIEYEYFVGDQPYFSNRLSFQKGNTRSPKEALKVMNRYRRHHEVMVYYNPKDPRESVLEPGDIDDIVIPLMIGGLSTLLGLVL